MLHFIQTINLICYNKKYKIRAQLINSFNFGKIFIQPGMSFSIIQFKINFINIPIEMHIIYPCHYEIYNLNHINLFINLN